MSEKDGGGMIPYRKSKNRNGVSCGIGILHRARLRLFAWLLLAMLFFTGNTFQAADGLPKGALDRTESLMNPVLLDYYQSFLKTQDVDKFLQSILARYNDATLLRLMDSSQIEVRRAAVLALGLVGGPKCNGPVAARMKDSDPMVRSFAEHALWGIWFRSDTPEHNQELTEIRNLISEQRLDEAMTRVNKLIDTAPQFAEARNQRAILHFIRGELDKSVDDCRAVVKRNPFHFGALSGMAQSLVKLGKPKDALDVFQELIKIQPHNEAVMEAIDMLQRDRL